MVLDVGAVQGSREAVAGAGAALATRCPELQQLQCGVHPRDAVIYDTVCRIKVCTAHASCAVHSYSTQQRGGTPPQLHRMYIATFSSRMWSES